MKFIGSDGISSDETATRYYLDSNGTLYAELWGDRIQIDPSAARKTLQSQIEAYEQMITLDPVDWHRMANCKKLFAELEKLD